MKTLRIIITGSIAIDRIMNFGGRYKDLIDPSKIHILSISVFLKNLVDTYGGVGANICYTLALLGEKPILIGAVGKDAKEYIRSLKNQGIITNGIHLSHLPTASFNVITDSDDNQVGGFFPGAMLDSSALSLKPLIQDRSFFVISPHDPKAMNKQVAECKKYNLRLFYDPGQQVLNSSAKDLYNGINAAELLILNDYELSTLSKRIGVSESSIKQKVPIVVTTLGKKGSIIEGARVKASIAIPTVKPKVLKDPTGAGDAYRAGFLYGYVRNWSLYVCGKMGALAATYAIEYHGTQNHFFTKKSFSNRYKEVFNEKLILL